MSGKFIIVATWTVFAGIAFVTLSSAGLRPALQIGILSGSVPLWCWAYFLIWPTLAAGRCSPSFARNAQLFIPGRDREFLEMLIKAAGGLAGMGVAIVLSRLFPRTD
jgi:hypothetical protein